MKTIVKLSIVIIAIGIVLVIGVSLLKDGSALQGYLNLNPRKTTSLGEQTTSKLPDLQKENNFPLQKTTIIKINNNLGHVFFDSTSDDPDFDNVMKDEDECPNEPNRIMAHLFINDVVKFEGQNIRLVEVDANLSASFEVVETGKWYGTSSEGTDYVSIPKISNDFSHFTIRQLYAVSGTNGWDHVIIALRKNNILINTGCAN